MAESVLGTGATPAGEKQATIAGVATEQRDVAAYPSVRGQPEGHSVEVLHLVRIGLVGLAALASWFRIWEPFPRVDVMGLLATLVGGYPIFREAFEDIRSRRMTPRGRPSCLPVEGPTKESP